MRARSPHRIWLLRSRIFSGTRQPSTLRRPATRCGAAPRGPGWLRIGSHGTGHFGGSDLPKPSCLVLLYTGHSDVASTEPPTFVAVGEDDGIAPAAVRKLGTDVEYRKDRGVGHGFGLGPGTTAEGWIGDAVRFWQRQIKDMTTSPLLTLNDGVQMPAIGLGVFQSSPEDTVTAVESAIAGGYRLIDTAASYFNERQVGEGIRRSGISRDHIFIETKVWISDYGYEATLHAFDKSAGKLGVDRLDLLLLHQPLPSRFDSDAGVHTERSRSCWRTAGSAR